MRYYESSVSIENGKYVYGNLPEDFVLGYVHEDKGFFALHPGVELPKDADVKEISEQEYESLFQQLNQADQERRLQERDEAISQLEGAQKKRAEEAETLAQRFMNAVERYEKAYEREDTSLLSLKELKIEALKELCSAATYEGFESKSTGHSFGFNILDQSNFTQRMLTIVAGAEGPFKWKTKDAGVVELSKEDFTKVIYEAEDHKLEQQSKFWALEVEVLAAESKEDVHAINWEVAADE